MHGQLLYCGVLAWHPGCFQMRFIPLHHAFCDQHACWRPSRQWEDELCRATSRLANCPVRYAASSSLCSSNALRVAPLVLSVVGPV